MASSGGQLPEGTDTIIEGAGITSDSSRDDQPAISALGSGSASSGSEAKGQFFDRIEELRGQAGDKARDLAQAGKDRATGALDNLVQTVEEAAAEIDEKLGSQYGDYARRAAEYIGNFSDSFRDKDVDDLFNDARDLVKKSPAVAIGAAAAVGFVVARLARAGVAGRPNGDDPQA